MMGICWSSLLNQNKKCGMVSTKKVCRSGQEYVIYTLLVENIPAHFY